MQKRTQLGLACLLLIGAAAHSHAQSGFVQTLNFKLTVYNQVTDTSITAVRVTTKDVIRYFAGQDVVGGQLQLVTPGGNPPGTIGNLGAFLRVISGNTVVTEVPSPDWFNLFQDMTTVSAGARKTMSHAINRFSIDYGAFHAELQGFSTWNFGASGTDPGTGTFVSSVNGLGTIDGVTQQNAPIQGTVTASAPKPGA